MTKQKTRSANDYWLGRLQREYPEVYRQLAEGELPSIRAACIKAGLVRDPTSLDVLKREWKKADRGERQEFVRWTRNQTKEPGWNPLEGDGSTASKITVRIDGVVTGHQLETGDILIKLDEKKA